MEDLLDPKLKKILFLLANNPHKLFHLKKISADSKVPLSTTFRVVNKLSRLDYFTIVKVGKLKLYKCSDKALGVLK